MMCLTVANPWPFLIFADQSDLRDGDTPKRVENRSWPTSYRGPLLIHAGKTKSWLRPGDDARYPQMLYGYVLGTVDLVACIPSRWNTVEESEAELPARWKWVAQHEHCRWKEGMYWWVLENVRRFAVPVKARGMQGLFDLAGDWELKKHDAAAVQFEPLKRRIHLEA